MQKLMAQLYSTASFLILITTLPAQAQSNNPIPFQTQIDSHVQTIFNSLASALIKKSPWSDETTSATLSDDSDLSTGRILSQFTLNASSQGQVVTSFSSEGDTARIQTDIMTKTNPRFFYETATVSLGRPVTSLADLKSQILISVAELQVQEERRRISLGSSAASPTGLSADAKAALLAALEGSLQLTTTESEELLVVNMAPLQTVLDTTVNVIPAVGWLKPLQQLQVRSSTEVVEISIQTVSLLPQSIITNYDAYLANQQASASGLSSQADLIQSIASWVVRLCSAEDYQQECLNKVLYECSRSVERIGSCVSQAESLRGVIEARRDGDTLGVITNGAEAIAREGAQNVVDWVIGD